MWPRLNVWVMAPGNAARIDDRDGWVVFTADAHQKPFGWKGFDYTAGTTTSEPGFVEYELPPGTYVVWAQRKEKKATVRTHTAVVAIHDEPVVTVRLLPDLVAEDKPRKEEPEDECRVGIGRLSGYMRGSDWPKRLELTGTAGGCSEVRIVIRRTEGNGKVQGTATVESDGTWLFKFDNEVELRCGETVLVDVVCARNEKCRERAKVSVHCREADH